ncbi:MAG: toxin-antitoxin system YwqK family antitoxin [Saprospiraceae bacterium]
MNLKLLFFACLFLSLPFISAGQNNQEHRSVVIKTKEVFCKIELALDSKKTRLLKDRFYFSYYNHKIYKSRFGASTFGHFLHGRYEDFYLDNKAIKEIGHFKHGLKEGIWKSWYADGQLKQIHHWRRGVKHGRFELFDPAGQLSKKGNYRHGKLHGKIREFKNGAVVRTIKYQKGAVKQRKKKKMKKEKKSKEKSS